MFDKFLALRAAAGGAGGASSWNDLKDKPFGEETEVVEPISITWDGNTDRLVEVVENGDSGTLQKYYKISDIILTDEQIKTANVSVYEGNIANTEYEYYNHKLIESEGFWEYAIENHAPEGYIWTESGEVVFVRKDNLTVKNYTFPEAGIYFMRVHSIEWDSVAFTTSITTIEQTKTVIKKLDEKYLPDGVGGGAFFVDVTQEETYTCVPSVTWEEANAALEGGRQVFLRNASKGTIIPLANKSNGILYWNLEEYATNTKTDVNCVCYRWWENTSTIEKSTLCGTLNSVAPPM